MVVVVVLQLEFAFVSRPSPAWLLVVVVVVVASACVSGALLLLAATSKGCLDARILVVAFSSKVLGVKCLCSEGRESIERVGCSGTATVCGGLK